MIRNRTTGSIVAEKFEIADSFLAKLRGLTFRKKISKPLLFIFKSESRSRASIHSLFMFFPFDAVFLDARKRIVDIRERIPPFTPLVVPLARSKFLLEMGAGEARAKKLKIGDRLEW
ncbi:MAG: DUF192 domain-containing protein [Candidatus Micrarchaeota archaeon]